MSVCQVRKIKLTKRNCYPSHLRHFDNLCKKCTHQRDGAVYQLHRDEILAKQRRTQVGTIIDGKETILFGHKRPYPLDHCCEVCHRYAKLLQYHHWDHSDLSRGLWVCYNDHTLVERVDDNFHIRYLLLRFKIDVCSLIKRLLKQGGTK